MEDQEQKQVDALKSLESSDKQLPSIKDFVSKERLSLEIIDEIKRIKEKEKKSNDIAYKRYNKTYDFRKFKTIRVSGNDIRNNIINMYKANDEQNHLTKYIK